MSFLTWGITSCWIFSKIHSQKQFIPWFEKDKNTYIISKFNFPSKMFIKENKMFNEDKREYLMVFSVEVFYFVKNTFLWILKLKSKKSLVYYFKKSIRFVFGLNCKHCTAIIYLISKDKNIIKNYKFQSNISTNYNSWKTNIIQWIFNHKNNYYWILKQELFYSIKINSHFFLVNL